MNKNEKKLQIIQEKRRKEDEKDQSKCRSVCKKTWSLDTQDQAFISILCRITSLTLDCRTLQGCLWLHLSSNYIIDHFGYRDQVFKFNDTTLKGSDFWPFKKNNRILKMVVLWTTEKIILTFSQYKKAWWTRSQFR